jgi:hypothetical protein
VTWLFLSLDCTDISNKEFWKISSFKSVSTIDSLRPSIDVFTLFNSKVWTASFFVAAYHISFAICDYSDLIWWFFSVFSSLLLNIYFKNGISVMQIWIINLRKAVIYNLSFSSSSLPSTRISLLFTKLFLRPLINALS